MNFDTLTPTQLSQLTQPAIDKVTEWKNDGLLQGEQGIQGERGEKGDKGDRGEAGQNGTNGVDGRDGVDGQDAAPLTITSQSLDADGNRVLVFSDGTSVTIPKGQQGDAGTTDYDQLTNKPTFKTINSESIVGEGNIVVGGGDSVWELLIDDTTTEEIQCWTFNQGKDGQVFDSYKELIMFLVYQPSSIAKTALQIGFSGVGAWSKGYIAIGVATNLVTLYAIISCKKTPFGIVVDTNQSQNNSSLSNNLTNYISNQYQMVVDANANSINPSSSIGLKSYRFETINVGSYSTAIGIDSRLVIYGKK